MLALRTALLGLALLLAGAAAAEHCDDAGADRAFCTCAAGQYKVHDGGRGGSSSSSSACAPCPEGHAQGRAETLGDSCHACYGMTYQPHPGQAHCLRCPDGQWGHGTFCGVEPPAKAERKLAGFPFVDKRRRLADCPNAPAFTTTDSFCTCPAGTYRKPNDGSQ